MGPLGEKMALFVLREGFRVEATPTGGRVVHLRTGDALELTFVEVQLLARAAAGGLTADDPAMRPVVRKLASLGLLVRAASPAQPTAEAESSSSGAGLWVFEPPAGGAEFEVPAEVGADAAEVEFEPEIVVDEPTSSLVPTRPEGSSPIPTFRADLVLGKKGNLFEVSDPTSGKRFTFYDFEISLARMLNGQRTWTEVIEAGNRLGIPVNLASLAQFVRQLERYGFLGPAGTLPPPAPPESIWGKRDKWEDSIRNLFQSGLRLTRQGRYYEAAAYFEAILEHDPANAEAQEMLGKVQEHLAKEPQVAVPLDSPASAPLPVDAPGTLDVTELLAPEPEAPAVAEPPGVPELVDVDLVTAPPSVEGTVEGLTWMSPPQSLSSDLFEEPTRPSAPALDASLFDEPAFAPPVQDSGASPIQELPHVESASPAPDLGASLFDEPPPPPAPVAPAGNDLGASLFDEPEAVAPAATPATGADLGASLFGEPALEVAAASVEEEVLEAELEPESEAPVVAEPPSAPPPPVSAPAPVAAVPAAAKSAPRSPVAIFGSVGLGVLALAAGWYFAIHRPKAAAPPAAAGPDAAAVVVAPAGPDAAALEVVSAGLDAALAADAEAPAVASGPDAAMSGADAAAAAVASGRWNEIEPTRRGRVTMGEVRAPEAGTLSWAAQPQERIKKGQTVGAVNGTALKAPKAGLLMPKAAEGASVAADELLAAVLYHEGYVQAVVASAEKPEPTWSCEILDAASGQRAPCKVVSGEPRKNGFFVTATAEPLWFDTAATPRLRIAPP